MIFFETDHDFAEETSFHNPHPSPSVSSDVEIEKSNSNQPSSTLPLTASSAVDELKEEPSHSDGHLSYSVGDIVWAYTSGYPLWPSVVSVAPAENLFTRVKGISFKFLD